MNWLVTICRNGVSLTRNAVRSFLGQDINVEVLLIDNGTEDGTREAMRPYETVRVMQMHGSVAECWNTALGWIFDLQKADYVLVANNDVELHPATYRTLLEDGGLFVTAVGGADKTKIQTFTEISGDTRPHPDFSCFLIRKECWDRVGRFDEKFKVAYCEDMDYHIRMHQAGINAYCIDMPFYHPRSGTLKNASEAERQRICTQADRNREYFFEKWGVRAGSPEYYALFGTTALEGEES